MDFPILPAMANVTAAEFAEFAKYVETCGIQFSAPVDAELDQFWVSFCSIFWSIAVWASIVRWMLLENWFDELQDSGHEWVQVIPWSVASLGLVGTVGFIQATLS